VPCTNRSESKGASTISWYDGKLRGLLRWLQAQGYATDLGGFAVDRVREFILRLHDREDKFERNPFIPTRREKLSGHTIRRYVRGLKAFASCLYEEGYTVTNVLPRYRMPEARQAEPEWLRRDEIDRLLKVFDRNTTLGARDYARMGHRFDQRDLVVQFISLRRLL
jgi:site-specific recombinase XerD